MAKSIGELTVVSAATSDHAVVTRTVGDPVGRRVTVPDLLSLHTHMVEIREDSAVTITSVGPNSTQDFTFSANHSLSAATGSTSADILVADAANNRITVPPNSQVYCEWGFGFVPGATQSSLYVLQVKEGSTYNDDTRATGFVDVSSKSDSHKFGIAAGSGYIANEAGSTDLQIKLGVSAFAGSVTQDLLYQYGFFRAWYVKPHS